MGISDTAQDDKAGGSRLESPRRALLRDEEPGHARLSKGAEVGDVVAGAAELLLLEVGQSAAPLQRGRHIGFYHFGLRVDDELRELLATLVL